MRLLQKRGNNMITDSDQISILRADILKKAEELAQQKRDVISDILGSFPHYMDLLESVTYVNHDWDNDPKLHQKIKQIQQKHFSTCFNLGSGNINPDEEQHLIKSFNVDNILNVDMRNLKAVNLVADIIDLPFPDDFVEFTYNSSVLEHLPEPLKAIKENYRVLKPKGYAYFWVPFLWREHDADLWRFTKSGLQLLLHKAGFQKIDLFTTQTGFGNCLSTTSIQSVLQDYNRDFTNVETNYRKLLFLLIHDYAQKNSQLYPEQFYCGVCAICKK